MLLYEKTYFAKGKIIETFERILVAGGGFEPPTFGL